MTDRELERRANRRLAVLRHVEEVSGNVAATCRYYGISWQCYYGWLCRYEADGFDGLKDRSSRPHHSPWVTQAEVIEKILWLRWRALPPWPVSVCSWKIRVARPSWRGPVGCSSPASTRVAALHTRTSAINSAGM